MRLASFAFALCALLGCKDARDPGAPAAAQALTIKGSDTMVILAQRLAEKFMATAPEQTIQVTGGGSGTGIAALTNGTTDLANSSRTIKEEEKQRIEKLRGASVFETIVALDGLAVFVHASNPLPSITIEQLREIYTGELTNWSELGGAAGPIILYGRENNSGTYTYFKERVLDGEDFAAETQTLPGTAAVVNAVTLDPKGIGYGGVAFQAGIRTVPVQQDETSPAVEPTIEDVRSGRYPISRPLYVYSVGEPKAAAKAFLAYALSPEGQAIVGAVGYYPLPKPAPAQGVAAPGDASDADQKAAPAPEAAP